MGRRLQFDANGDVYVRLTSKGQEILRSSYGKHAPKPDRRGFTRFTLWRFMELFGPHTTWGENPYDLRLEFRPSQVREVSR